MTATAPQLPASGVEEQLSRRREGVVTEAHRVLGRPGAASPLTEMEQLRNLISEVGEHLAAERPAEATTLVAEHEAALERLRQRFDARFEALARVQEAVSELREATSPATILGHAPAALCNGSALRRVLLSLLRGGRMVAEAGYFAGDPDGCRGVVEQLRAAPLLLEHPLIETELMRRRRATIVVDAHVHPRVSRRLTELMGWQTYVAAPLVVGTQVIGVIHADRGPDQQLDVLDRDVLWEFASGLAQVYESAILRRTLLRERDQMREFLEWLRARSGELSDAPITLGGQADIPLPPPQPLEDAPPPEGRDDRTVFEGLLTRRELEVLRLLAEGNSNKAIADALVVSTGTVKFHVNSLLRKLHAANRAEAVSRYLRLLGMRPP